MANPKNRALSATAQGLNPSQMAAQQSATNKPAAAKKAAALPEAPAVKTASKAQFVMVGSKLPQNLEIQLCTTRHARETGQFGSVDSVVHVKTGEIHLLRGTAYPSDKPPKGFPKRPDMIEDDNGGYAMSKIPAEFMARWMEENKDTDMVRNRVIIVKDDVDSLIDAAKDQIDVSSGLGPMNPDGDPRAPKPTSTSVQGVKPEQRPAA